MSPSPALRALRCLVAGRVQGVYYRAATAARAQQLGVHGSVRNLPDGRVEVIVKGGAAEIAELATWLWQGPPAARVEAVDMEEWLAPVAEGFVVSKEPV